MIGAENWKRQPPNSEKQSARKSIRTGTRKSNRFRG